MAKKIIKEKSIEETLWQSCDKLRGSVEPAEYKHVVLGLIFLKFANDKFEERRKELIAKGKEKYVETKDFHTMKNVFFLEEILRWSYNPNLAVVADAEQIVYVNLDKDDNYTFSTITGSIENKDVNKKIVAVLEGAMPAFNKRKDKYYE